MRFMMQDCILAEGEICTAGSRMLRNFKAPYSATAYERCLEAGMQFAGLTTPDEFCVDSLFEDAGGHSDSASHSGSLSDSQCGSCPDGSGQGQDETQDASVAALLSGECDAVLCNDLFGKLRRQAPHNGLVYIHPAYGTVSRHGLIPAASSMDQIGVLSRSLDSGLAALSAISGHDPKDGTSLPQTAYRYSAGKPQATAVGVPGTLFDDLHNAALSGDLPADIGFPEGIKPIAIDLEYFRLLPYVFYILSAAEICNNATRYDGVKFGYRAEGATGIEDLYVRSRTEGFGRDMKLASVVGCMALSEEHYGALYDKSMQIRRLAQEHYSALLARTGIIALPTRLGGCGKLKQSALYALPALCGFASMAARYKNAAVQFICKRGDEDAMFSLAGGAS